jgi:hypothetical protein
VVRFEARAFGPEPEDILGEVTATETLRVLVVPLLKVLQWSKWVPTKDVTKVTECPECGQSTRCYGFQRARAIGPFCDDPFHTIIASMRKPALEIHEEIPR